jgi:hypothetical protein
MDFSQNPTALQIVTSVDSVINFFFSINFH